MTDWFRSWHGAPTDNKWLVIGRRANVAPGMVSAVWWALMDHASQALERGNVQDFDVETYAAFSGFEEAKIEAVLEALRGDLIIEGSISWWWETRPERLLSSPNRPPLSVWEQIRILVFRRDDYTCRYCGDRGVRLECDHVFPASRGGGSELHNLATACVPCNRSKRDKTPEEWKA